MKRTVAPALALVALTASLACAVEGAPAPALPAAPAPALPAAPAPALPAAPAVASPLSGDHAGQALRLTLKEAIARAAERNFDVRAELYNPAAAEAQVRQNLGIYDSNLTLSGSVAGNDSLATDMSSVVRQRTSAVDLGANQLLSTGGILGVAFNNSWNRTGTSLSSETYFDSQLLLTFSQPLLKNFGRETTELSISVARIGKEASLEQFRTKLMDTVSQVRREYYNLYALREDLEVKRTSLALAQKVLDETNGRVRAGVLPAMEIQNAEFGVASREKDLIDAERAVRDEVDLLRNLVRIDDTAADIVPVDPPLTDPVPLDVAAEIRTALTRRSELQALRANLAAAELQARVARARVMPDLSVSGSAGVGGLAGNYPRDLDRLSSGRYPVWSVGVNLSYPLENRTAENEYQLARIKAEQLKVQIASSRAGIENEVRSAVRGVDSGFKQLDVTERGRVYAEERFRSYLKKSQVGLATNKDVLDVERDLANAKSSQVRAKADYATALTQLWRVTGVLLEREGITVTEKAADELLVVK